jgi:hypothetical protein
VADCQIAAGKLEIGKGEKMSDSDNQLFENLAIKHMDNLYSNAIRLTRSAKGAEYLVQQTYATAFLNGIGVRVYSINQQIFATTVLLHAVDQLFDKLTETLAQRSPRHLKRNS